MAHAWRSLLALVLLVAAPLGGVARAQNADADTDTDTDAQPAMAFVRLSEIFSKSQLVSLKRSDINAEFATREDELEGKIAQLQKLVDDIERNALTQTVSQKGIDQQQALELERDIKREDRDLAEDKRERFEEANAELERIISEKIQQVASERKVFLVFELSAVLFAEKRLDLTQAVITALDSAATDTKVAKAQ